MAFVAAARAVWLIFKDEEDKSLRHFNFLKCNLTGEALGFSFRIEEKNIVYQEGTMIPSMTEALAPAEVKEEKKKERAKTILRIAFENCPELPAAEVIKLGLDDGIGETTLRTAAKSLRIKKKKTPEGNWIWYI